MSNFNYSKSQQTPQQNLNAKVKVDLAVINKNISETSVSNGDEELYKDNTVAPYAGSFHKLLPHDLTTGQLTATGKASFEQLIKALGSGKQSDFDAITLFDNNAEQLADPQASLNYCLIGLDNSSVSSITPPTLASPEAAAEMVENYCKELCRDVPFINWSTDLTVADVLDANHMNKADFLAAYQGPTNGGNITVTELFRGIEKDVTEGPYLSQFLYFDIPYGGMTLRQKYTVPKAKVLYDGGNPATDPTNPASSPVDFGVNKTAMIAIQNGLQDTVFNITDDRYQVTPKFLYNGRCLAESVHNDQLYQFYYNAAQILLNLGCPLDAGFITGPNEKAFTSFGGPVDILHHVASVTGLALKHAWYHKWQVHRRLRPEAFSLLVQNQKESIGGFNFINNVLMNNDILDDIETLHQDYYNVPNSYLLSGVYPENSPTHSSAPAGHGLVSHSACSILKIFFQGETLWKDLPNIVNNTKRVTNEAGSSKFIVAQANADGTDLVTYSGNINDMTVNSELNKLAANISLARDHAGVHRRSESGINIGEQIAINYMQDILNTYNQTYNGTAPVLTLEKFDGTVIQIKPNIIP